MSDLEDLLEFINSLVRKGTYIALQEEQSREEEINWLSDVLKDNERGGGIDLVAEADGNIVGNATMDPLRYALSHTAEFGISISKDMRDLGVGTKLAEVIFSEAKKRIGAEIAIVGVFEKNRRGRRFYEKLGLRKTGKIENGAKIDGEYQDSIVMQKELE